MKKIHIWPILALLAVLMPGAARAETTTFEYPMEGRFRLDYCRYEGVDCGIAAAFAFCQREGYRQIENYRGDRDVHDTQRMGDGSTCRSNLGHTCDGFEFITCSRDHAPPALETGPGSLNYPVRPYTSDSAEGDSDPDSEDVN